MPATPGRASTRRSTARERTDLLATRIGLPAARRSRSAAFASSASRSTTAKGGSRSAVARSSRRASPGSTSGRVIVAMIGSVLARPRSGQPGAGVDRRGARVLECGAVDEGGGMTQVLDGERTRWRNWAGNQQAAVEVVRPGSAEEVAEVLTSGRRVRPIGSGHSFTGVGRPDDVQLVADRLTLIRGITDDGLVTVGAGTPLHRLNAELSRRGWAMTNLGDIDRQTIAGALSTGTHGTGARFGGLATQ